jgi:hypothetical protein
MIYIFSIFENHTHSYISVENPDPIIYFMINARDKWLKFYTCQCSTAEDVHHRNMTREFIRG